MQAAIESDYIRPAAVARQIGVTKRTVLNMLYRHELEGIRFGRTLFVRKSSLSDYLTQHAISKEEQSN